VIGGLGKFADFGEEATPQAPHEQVSQIVTALRGYGTLPDRPARVQAIERIKTLMSTPVSAVPAPGAATKPTPPPLAAPAMPVVKPETAPQPVEAPAGTSKPNVERIAPRKARYPMTCDLRPARAGRPGHCAARTTASGATGFERAHHGDGGHQHGLCGQICKLGVKTIRDCYSCFRVGTTTSQLKPSTGSNTATKHDHRFSMGRGHARARGGAPIFTATLSDGRPGTVHLV
jgi:hypothetical protein